MATGEPGMKRGTASKAVLMLAVSGIVLVAGVTDCAGINLSQSPLTSATPVVGTDPPAASRHPGDAFKDCVDCPEMVVVPAGEFIMGSPWGEVRRADDEGPRHRVRIGVALAVGKFEVTVGEYRRFVRDSEYSGDAPCIGIERSGHNWESPGFHQGERYPVACVSWDDAQAYVKWLTGKTGERYRLLTEAEWEYAARAGTTRAFHTGSWIRTDQANFYGETYISSSKGGNRLRTVPVGSFGANRFGLHDMHGNLWELVEDCWNRSYEGAPVDGSAWMSDECDMRGVRGGSWGDPARYIRSASRLWVGTEERYNFVGFRVARTL